MNNKIVSTKKTNAIFLATVLVAGTIALISPSLLGEAQALGMNNNNFKSHNKDANAKCSNINANLNGLEGTIDVNGLLGLGDAAVQEDEELSATNAYENNGYRNNNNGDFDIYCINNNDNEGQGIRGPEGPEGPQGPPGISIADMTMYQVNGPIQETDDFNPATSRALCDDGDIAFNGGASFFMGAGRTLENQESKPVFDSTVKADIGWFASLSDIGTSGFSFLTTIVTCLDNPPLRP